MTALTCAIVLAAGRSQRMGAPKLLLPFAGSTVIARVVDAFLAAPVDTVIVVVRPDDDPLRAALAGRRVTIAANPDSEGDMLRSVRCGLRALPSATRTVLVSPGDLPLLTPALIREVLRIFRASGRKILVPVRAGRGGHPLVFDARFSGEILTAFDDVGLRGLLRAHPAEVFEWACMDDAVVCDVDTQADYQCALERTTVTLPTP